MTVIAPALTIETSTYRLTTSYGTTASPLNDSGNLKVLTCNRYNFVEGGHAENRGL